MSGNHGESRYVDLYSCSNSCRVISIKFGLINKNQMNRFFTLLVISFMATISMACVSGSKHQSEKEGDKTYTVLAPETFRDSVSRGDIVLVDVRRPDEYSAGHLKGAKMVTWGDEIAFVAAAKQLEGKVLFIYCRSGRRSNAAGKYLTEKMGFKVYDLGGGYLAWTEKGYEIEK